MNVQQGPSPTKKTLIETVAAILQEDIQPQGLDSKILLRQPPFNDDDYDSWATVKGAEHSPEKWQCVAESVIKAIDRYRSNNESTASEQQLNKGENNVRLIRKA